MWGKNSKANKNRAVTDNTQTNNLLQYYKRQPKTEATTIEVSKNLKDTLPDYQNIIPLDATITSSARDVEKQDSSNTPNSIANESMTKSPHLSEPFHGYPQTSTAQSSVADTVAQNNRAEPSNLIKQSHKKLYPIFVKTPAVDSTPDNVPRNLETKLMDDHSPSEQYINLRLESPNPPNDQFPEIVDLTTPVRERILDQTVPIEVLAFDNGVTALTQDGSQERPINLTSSPAQGNQPVRRMHPFFVRYSPSKKESKGTAIIHTSGSIPKPIAAAWPTFGLQHIKGPQSFFKFSGQPPSREREISISHDAHVLLADQLTIVRLDRSIPAHQSMTLVPSLDGDTSTGSNKHAEHPGITRFNRTIPSSSVNADELWTRKWRPRRAAEVLGNESHALFLCAWLKALTVEDQSVASRMDESKISKATHAIKRPTIIRKVEREHSRKRRRISSDDEEWVSDDWLVGDEDEEKSESESLHTGVSELPPLHGESSRPDKGESTTFPSGDVQRQDLDFTTLTNTILLEGPSGSGKTCTVYACAEELGWEVFEVYPGIGKRSGTSISSLIGDVGKNHIVRRRGIPILHARQDDNDKHNPDHFGRHGEKNKMIDQHYGLATIQQSIILLEEVDILFKEDVNFWTAVINLIETSHRPVIMTCNDASLVPQADLPLQACLHFKPCPPSLAVSFLHSACLAEGCQVERKELERMYTKTYSLISNDERDEPSLPFPSQARPYPDLRRTINDMQFRVAEGGTVLGVACDEAIRHGCDETLVDWATGPWTAESTLSAETYDIYSIWKHMEYASCLDAYLERRPLDMMEALSMDRYGPCADDEVGHTLLDKPRLHNERLAFYNWDTELLTDALTLSRHVVEASGVGRRARRTLWRGKCRRTRYMDHGTLIEERMAYQHRAASFLDDVMSLASPLLPRPAVTVDYVPYVCQMILADDAMEAEAAAAAAAAAEEATQQVQHYGRRRVRRWQTTEGYPRYLNNVSTQGQAGARNLAFSE